MVRISQWILWSLFSCFRKALPATRNVFQKRWFSSSRTTSSCIAPASPTSRSGWRTFTRGSRPRPAPSARWRKWRTSSTTSASPSGLGRGRTAGKVRRKRKPNNHVLKIKYETVLDKHDLSILKHIIHYLRCLLKFIE